MDRKGWIVVILCAVGIVLYTPYMMRSMQPPPAAAPGEAAPEAVAETPSPAERGMPTQAPSESPAPAAGAEERTLQLKTDKAVFEFSNLGGGIVKAELLEHAATLEPNGSIILNEHGPGPVGALASGAGSIESQAFTVVRHDDREVVFERTDADGIRITKRYSVPDGEDADGYLIDLDITMVNGGSKDYVRKDVSLYTGALAPLHPAEWPQQTGFAWRDYKEMRYKPVSFFNARRFIVQFSEEKELLQQSADGLIWAGVMNQFYAILVTSRAPAPGEIWASRFPVELKGYPEARRGAKPLHAIQGGVGLPEIRLGRGQQSSFSYEIYLGPKEYARLNNLGKDRREIMNYGNFPVLGWVVAPVSRLLVRALVFLEGKVGSFGIAILIITFVIRILIWPLHAKSTRTMKRMASLSPKMAELKEKYPDDPQKLNQEMMALYKDYGVNPFGGCLPAFLQLPIFLGFYRMLQSAVELRHEGFLWVQDLSMPDTLFRIPFLGDLPFNLMPLLMAVTMLIQMKVAPKSGDKTQQRIFMFMPVIFLFICYNFASALALYWTAQNIFSIGQTWYMGRLPEPELVKKKDKPGGTSNLMEQAKNRTKVAGQGPQHTKSKAQKRKRRK